MVEQEELWTTIAKSQLEGRTIVAVRYMSTEEQEQLGWSNRCVMLQLDNGNLIWPSADDEGNNAGALFSNDQSQPVIPVL